MQSAFSSATARDYYFLNGAGTRFGETFQSLGTISFPQALSMAALMPITASDYVTIQGFSGSVAGMSASPTTSFTAFATNGRPYYIRSTVSPSSTQSIPGSTVTALTSFWGAGTTLLSSGTIFSSASNGQIQVSQPGAYLVFANVHWVFGSANNNFQAWFLKNGATTTGTNRICFYADGRSSTNDIAYTLACLVVLNTNDYLVLNVYQDTGTYVITAGASILWSIGMLRIPDPYGSLASTTVQNVLNAQDTELTAYWSGGTFLSDATGIVTNPSAGRLQVSQAGGYFVTFNVYFGSSTANTLRRMWLIVNGVGTVTYGAITNAAGSGVALLGSSAFVNLAAGDYVSVWVNQQAGGTLGIDGSSITTWFSVVQMSSVAGTSSPTVTTPAPTTPTTLTPTVPALAPSYVSLVSGATQVIGSSADTPFTFPSATVSSVGTAVTNPSTGKLYAATSGAFIVSYAFQSASSSQHQSYTILNSLVPGSTTYTAYTVNSMTDIHVSATALTILNRGDSWIVNSFISTGATIAIGGSFAMTYMPQRYIQIYGGTTQVLTTSVVTELTSMWTGATSSSGSIWNVPSAGRLQVLASGWYLVQYQISMNGGSAAVKQFWLSKNSAGAVAARWAYQVSTDGTTLLGTGQAFLQLSANDYVSVYAYQTTGSNMNAGATYNQAFSVMLMDPFPYFSVSCGTVQNLAYNVYTELNTYWTGGTTLNGNGGSSIFTLTSGRIRVSKGGAYFVTANVHMPVVNTGLKIMEILVNGAGTPYGTANSDSTEVCFLSFLAKTRPDASFLARAP